MANLPEHERIRELLNRLDEIQRESEMLRAKIDSIRRSRREFPAGADAGFDRLRASSEYLFRVVGANGGREPDESPNGD